MLIYMAFDMSDSICFVCDSRCNYAEWRNTFRDKKYVLDNHENRWSVEPVFLFDEAWEC